MKNSRWQWMEYAGLFSLFLTLTSLAVGVTTNFRPLYIFDIRHLQILDYTSLDQETLLKDSDHLVNYLNNSFKTILSLPDFLVSASGVHHFCKVRILFLVDYIMFFITLVPSILSIKYLQKDDRFWRLIRPFQIGTLLPVVFGFFVMVGSDHFFILSHETFFNGDDWLFNSVTDPIVSVPPGEFFMHSFILFFVLLELFFAVFLFLGKNSLKQTKRKELI